MELRRRRRAVLRRATAQESDASSDDQARTRRKGKAKVTVESESEAEAMEIEEQPPVPEPELEPAMDLDSGRETRIRLKAKNLTTARHRAAFYARYSANNKEELFSRARQPHRQAQIDGDEDFMDDDLAEAPKPVEPPPPKIIEWEPSRGSSPDVDLPGAPPSLFSMCIELLCQKIDHVESLEGVPEALKCCITSKLYELGKITPKAAQIIMAGPLSQILLPDCSKIPEKEFTELMENSSLDEVQALELGFCGRALSDQMLLRFAFPKLRKLRLHGNYRVSDSGLRALIQSATRGLRDVELVECCCITESSVQELATFHGPFLQSLSLEGCDGIIGRKVLPSLLRLPELTVLSLASVKEVTDEVLSELMVARGLKLEELNISHCSVTDHGMAAVAACGSTLKSLHLEGLELTDVTLHHLTEGCKTLCKLSLDGGDFSDEVLADFVAAAGSSLRNLSIASVKKAGDRTLVALAKHASRTLETLNASFCRRATEDGFGFLADSCPNLVELGLFGCTQVTKRFINGHSNKALKLVGEQGGTLSWHMNIREV
ncbi:uncharacterized protein LOC112347808 [Selaginella moellendorffii]|uniref:uncharacterized protein LOC112347808 n=1 Tax=Selaginella moellendorffii TaxID=88036 RepID=UPI000D1C35AF|nr:uncharacterized protein LOC112347808 [Selaginella moellendorffii]|eukprot:XP_024535026.1 uncharacterized protein LOC112347808 [Selaginella moellendorffii]